MNKNEKNNNDGEDWTADEFIVADILVEMNTTFLARKKEEEEKESRSITCAKDISPDLIDECSWPEFDLNVSIIESSEEEKQEQATDVAADDDHVVESSSKPPKKRRNVSKPRRRNNRISDSYQAPDIPPIASLDGLIGECSKPFVKELTETDLDKNQQRLCLSKDHVEKYMLQLLRDDEDVADGIPLIVYDSEGTEYEMRFIYWASKMYVINSKGWITFCDERGWITGIDTVAVWMFRHTETEKLCIAINSERPELPVWKGKGKRKMVEEEQ